jgi:uncharacterized damage-inducible protein DinB
MTWTVPVPDPVDGPMTGDTRPMLEGYLGWQRATLLNICAGLTGEQLAARPLPSNLSLLGLIRHMAKVERIWLRQRMAGEAMPVMYDAALGKDADFDDVHAASAEADYDRLVQEWPRCDAAVRDIELDATIDVHGEAMSLRMIYVHLCNEYARHNGHADLLREATDGVTGR